MLIESVLSIYHLILSFAPVSSLCCCIIRWYLFLFKKNPTNNTLRSWIRSYTVIQLKINLELESILLIGSHVVLIESVGTVNDRVLRFTPLFGNLCCFWWVLKELVFKVNPTNNTGVSWLSGYPLIQLKVDFECKRSFETWPDVVLDVFVDSIYNFIFLLTPILCNNLSLILSNLLVFIIYPSLVLLLDHECNLKGRGISWTWFYIVFPKSVLAMHNLVLSIAPIFSVCGCIFSWYGFILKEYPTSDTFERRFHLYSFSIYIMNLELETILLIRGYVVLIECIGSINDRVLSLAP